MREGGTQKFAGDVCVCWAGGVDSRPGNGNLET